MVLGGMGQGSRISAFSRSAMPIIRWQVWRLRQARASQHRQTSPLEDGGLGVWEQRRGRARLAAEVWYGSGLGCGAAQCLAVEPGLWPSPMRRFEPQIIDVEFQSLIVSGYFSAFAYPRPA